MKKETIFFSHSSRDKEAMNYLKNIIDEKTGGTLNIFLSSDGESIPFGTNWIHSIEQGLNEAIIMYVFITPNSIKSEWIYFESGYAYSKKVRVIPIGFGVDISELKPPLNLLQGFNLTSYEGLNNIVKILNDECQTRFYEDFQENDFLKLKNYSNFISNQQLWKYVNCFTTSIYSYTIINADSKEKITIIADIAQAYKKVKSIIESENGFSENKFNVWTSGLYVHKIDDQLEVEIEPNSLCIHFPKIVEALNIAYEGKEKHYVRVKLESGYILNSNHIKISSIIGNDERFEFVRKTDSYYPIYKFEDLEFFIREPQIKLSKNDDVFLQIIFPRKDVSKQILELVNALYEHKVIYEISDER